MKLPGKLQGLLRVPKLTLTRIGLALAVAVAADGLQFCTGPLGWAGIDEVIDVVTVSYTHLLKLRQLRILKRHLILPKNRWMNGMA